MTSSTSALVLRDCHIFDGMEDSLTEGELWIAGGRIVEPRSAPVREMRSLRGRIVAPGLIDAHVHLCLDGGPDPLAAFRTAPPSQLMEQMRINAARTLAAGITTVRDLGAPTSLILQLRAEIESGLVSGPRLLASGAPITAPEGHLHEMGGAVRGEDAVRRFVRAQRDAGADLIKVMVTGGGLSPQTDPRVCQFSDDEMRAAVQVAHAAGLLVAAHAHADAGIRQAVAAGVRSIEHGSYASPATLEVMRAAGTALVPTLLPAVAALEQPLSAERRAAIADRFASRRRVVREAVRLSVRIVAGTDAGVVFTPHGHVLGELQALGDCGIPPARALTAAGREAAVALGQPDLGTLVPGASADLLILEGNLLDDLSALSAPMAVMRMGEWVVPTTAARVYPWNRGSR